MAPQFLSTIDQAFGRVRASFATAASSVPPTPVETKTAAAYDAKKGLGYDHYLRLVVRDTLFKCYDIPAFTLLPGEPFYKSPTFKNLSIFERIGLKTSPRPASHQLWHPVKPDRRGIFGVPLSKQLSQSAMPFTVQTSCGRQVSVQLPALPAMFLTCLNERACVYNENTLLHYDYENTIDKNEPFLVNYVDTKSYNNIHEKGDSDDLVNAHNVFKTWLRSLPEPVIPEQLSPVIQAAFAPYGEQADDNAYVFGSEIPPQALVVLRCIVHLLRREEKTLLFATLNTCNQAAKRIPTSPLRFARMLAPCLMRTAGTRGSLPEMAFVNFLLIAVDKYDDILDAGALPQGFLAYAAVQHRLATAQPRQPRRRSAQVAAMSRRVRKVDVSASVAALETISEESETVVQVAPLAARSTKPSLLVRPTAASELAPTATLSRALTSPPGLAALETISEEEEEAMSPTASSIEVPQKAVTSALRPWHSDSSMLSARPTVAAEMLVDPECSSAQNVLTADDRAKAVDSGWSLYDRQRCPGDRLLKIQVIRQHAPEGPTPKQKRTFRTIIQWLTKKQ
ncbi:hypothetical protein RI367_004610 [Sorochytrium milnesiophthora]